MRRRPKPPHPEEPRAPPSAEAAAILQIKVWLVGISPMVWRRMLVPAAFTLRELHGVIQVTMGWEGIHLYDFQLRAARYGSWEAAASSPDVTLASLRLRTGARFIYEYDLNIPWRHEVRIEGRLGPEARNTYPVCTGGDGACPPEDCGGPESFMGRRNDWHSLDALEDLDTMVEVLQHVALKDGSEVVALDQEARWRLEDVLERGKARERARGRPFSRRPPGRDRLRQRRGGCSRPGARLRARPAPAGLSATDGNLVPARSRGRHRCARPGAEGVAGSGQCEGD